MRWEATTARASPSMRRCGFSRTTPDARIVLVGMESDVRRGSRRIALSRAAARERSRRQRSRRDARSARQRPARQEGFVDARRRQPGQGRRRAGLRFGRQHGRADGDLAFRAQDAAGHRPSGDRFAAADAQRRHRPRSISAPTSTARPSSSCSSRSWAARWLRRSTASSGPRSVCSTSARKTSRATTWSSRRASF